MKSIVSNGKSHIPRSQNFGGHFAMTNDAAVGGGGETTVETEFDSQCHGQGLSLQPPGGGRGIQPPVVTMAAGWKKAAV